MNTPSIARIVSKRATDAEIAPVLVGFAGDRLHTVSFALDSIRLVFDEHSVNIDAQPTLVQSGHTRTVADACFKDALCALIGEQATGMRIESDRLILAFNDSEIHIPFELNDGPEAAQICGPQGELIFRSDDVYFIAPE